VSVLPVDFAVRGALGFLVAVPLFLATLAAMVTGVVLGIRLRRDRALLVVSGMSLLFVVEFFTEFGSSIFYNGVVAGYGLAVVAVTGRWFLVQRGKRPAPAAPPGAGGSTEERIRKG